MAAEISRVLFDAHGRERVDDIETSVCGPNLAHIIAIAERFHWPS